MFPVVHKKRVGLFLAIAIIPIASVAFAVSSYLNSGDSNKKSLPQPTSTTKQIASQSTATPVRIFVLGSIETKRGSNVYTGTIRSRYETVDAFRVSGKILKRHVEVGQAVKKGDLLFELEPDDYILRLKSAEASLRVANATARQAVAEESRLAQLKNTPTISQSEYDLVLSAREIALGNQTNAERQLELAQNQLGYCKVFAEVDGFVMSIEAEAGEVVEIASTICTLSQGREFEAVVDIPENQLPIGIGMEADVVFWSLPDRPTRGILREISPIADPVTRTFRGRFSIPETPQGLQLGMTATVSWSPPNNAPGRRLVLKTEDPPEGFTKLTSESIETASKSNRDSSRSTTNPSHPKTEYAIPSSAIVEYEGRPSVWRVLRDASVAADETFQIEATPVRIIRYDNQTVLVELADNEKVHELEQGEWIVSAGVQKLDPMMRVRKWEIQK